MTEQDDAPEPVRFTRDNPAAQGPREGYWLTRMGNDAQGNALWEWVPIPGYADAPVNIIEAADALADAAYQLLITGQLWSSREVALWDAAAAYRVARGARSDA